MAANKEEAAAAIEKAQKAITKHEITEIKSLGTPPEGVRLVLEVICILMGNKPSRTKDDSGKFVTNYWEPSKKMLADPNFLKSLAEVDKDSIPPEAMQKIRSEYLGDPNLSPAKLMKTSKAAAGLCKWVLAIEAYDKAKSDEQE